MAAGELINRSALAARELHTSDEDGVPALVVIVKATVAIVPDRRCGLAETQVPVSLEGAPWGDDGETSSYKYEPEGALFKPGTDVVVVGHAHARAGDAAPIVGVEVGPLRRVARVVGARRWEKRRVGFEPTPPEPFDKVPLTWEECFGGGEPAARGSTIEVERRNPVGKGFLARGADPTGVFLPRLEDVDDPMTKPTQRPAPAGFGFVSPHWEPRVSFAGAFDERWLRERAPLLPTTFDRRFHNAGPAGLVSAAHLRGDEPVRLLGVTPGGGTLSFGLPAFAPPVVQVRQRVAGRVTLAMVLDTIIIEPDDLRVQLSWRGHVLVPDGPHVVSAIEIDGKKLDSEVRAAP